MSPMAGDFDYDTHGGHYAHVRRPDPLIARAIQEALGAAHTVLNVGAGTGSYEPVDRHVIALEPSSTMRAQRDRARVPAIRGTADAIPLDDGAVDASLALLTVHHWPDLHAGLRELRRVTRGSVVVLTFDPDALECYWLHEYAPEYFAAERRRYPALGSISNALGGRSEISTIAIPRDCTDGFSEALYARPEAFMDARVRRSQSGWGFVDEHTQERFVQTLGADLRSGAWDLRHGRWRTLPKLAGSLRLLVARPA